MKKYFEKVKKTVKVQNSNIYDTAFLEWFICNIGVESSFNYKEACSVL